MLNLFEHVHYPTFFCPFLTLCNLAPRSSLFDINIQKKKTMETSLDPTPSLKTSIDARVDGPVSNEDYL